MGGLVSALEAQDGAGLINGALTTCGIVAGAVNLNEYQLDGEYALAHLLLPGQQVKLVRFTSVNDALATAATLQAAAAQAQPTAAGRARLALALAFINTPPWDAGQAAPPPSGDPAAQEAAQYQVEFTGSFSTLDFIEAGRPSIDQADGGSANWTRGTNFAAVLARSPYRGEVTALYRAAGLQLSPARVPSPGATPATAPAFPRARPQERPEGGWWGSIRHWFGSGGWLRPAFAVLALFAVVQNAGLLGSRDAEQDDVRFRAVPAAPAATQANLVVRWKDGVRVDEADRLLQAVPAEVVGGPGANGVWRLRAADPVGGLAVLAASPLVESAGPATERP